MDWIEKLFGFAPDGGNGSTEVMIVFAACLVAGIVICTRVSKIKAYVQDLLQFRSRA